MKDGGPAYPSNNEITLGEYCTTGHAGMSLRDKFADSALRGVFSCERLMQNIIVEANESGKPIADVVALSCWRFADAMLKTQQEEK